VVHGLDSRILHRLSRAGWEALLASKPLVSVSAMMFVSAALQNVEFSGRTKMFVLLFQIRRQHIFDPFHECADSARQIAPMCHDEGHGERPAAKIRYDLHKRSTL
jgi:hypothetical protein